GRLLRRRGLGGGRRSCGRRAVPAHLAGHRALAELLGGGGAGCQRPVDCPDGRRAAGCVTVPASAAPEVSVVMPVRNGAALLREQLAALERQTFDGAWEVVVVDN